MILTVKESGNTFVNGNKINTYLLTSKVYYFLKKGCDYLSPSHSARLLPTIDNPTIWVKRQKFLDYMLHGAEYSLTFVRFIEQQIHFKVYNTPLSSNCYAN